MSGLWAKSSITVMLFRVPMTSSRRCVPRKPSRASAAANLSTPSSEQAAMAARALATLNRPMSLRRKVLPSNLYSVPSGSGLIRSAEKSALRPSIENVRLFLSGLRMSAQASQSALTTTPPRARRAKSAKSLRSSSTGLWSRVMLLISATYG